MCYLSFCWAYAAFIANGVFGLFFYFYHRYKIKNNQNTKWMNRVTATNQTISFILFTLIIFLVFF